MNQPSIPRLRWVVVEGSLVDVSEFKDLPPKSRPAAYCPVCERPVTLKLGQKRTYHFAHQPEDVCVATNPETALHLNCKFHIYQQLKTSTCIYTETLCQRCGNANPIIWKKDWDRVEVEYRMNSIRPDIALLQNGQVIGAIEVFVSHRVDEEKAARFDALGVDWIELRGHESLYEEADAWTIDKPLNTFRRHPTPEKWLCPNCQKHQEQEEYQRNNRTDIQYGCIIDLYFNSGKKYRYAFYVKCRVSYDETVRLWIEDQDRKLIAQERTPITEESKKRLNATFQQFYQTLQARALIIDHVTGTGWRQWGEGTKFHYKDFDRYPFRYKWDPDEKTWITEQMDRFRWQKLP